MSLSCPGCFAIYEAHVRAGEEHHALFCHYCASLLTEHAGEVRSAPESGDDPVGPAVELAVVQASDVDLRVWLDDDLVDRRAPAGWVQVTTARHAIRLLETGRVVELSLDHDLGDDERAGRGIDVIDFLAEKQTVDDWNLWPRDGITLHTANPYGRDAMARSIHRYAGKVSTVEESLTAGGKPRFRFTRIDRTQERS